MIERNVQKLSIAEAEWHLAATECKVLLAMRMRADGDEVVDDNRLTVLFDELVEAIARHRAVVTGGDRLDLAPAASAGGVAA